MFGLLGLHRVNQFNGLVQFPLFPFADELASFHSSNNFIAELMVGIKQCPILSETLFFCLCHSPTLAPIFLPSKLILRLPIIK